MDDNPKNQSQSEGLPWRAKNAGERPAMLEPSNRQLIIFFVLVGVAIYYAWTGNASHFATIMAAVSGVAGLALIYLTSLVLSMRQVAAAVCKQGLAMLLDRVLPKLKDRQGEHEE